MDQKTIDHRLASQPHQTRSRNLGCWLVTRHRTYQAGWLIVAPRASAGTCLVSGYGSDGRISSGYSRPSWAYWRRKASRHRARPPRIWSAGHLQREPLEEEEEAILDSMSSVEGCHVSLGASHLIGHWTVCSTTCLSEQSKLHNTGSKWGKSPLHKKGSNTKNVSCHDMTMNTVNCHVNYGSCFNIESVFPTGSTNGNHGVYIVHSKSDLYNDPWIVIARARLNIKMSSYQYRKSHCGDKTVVRSSYLHNGISNTSKMTSLYWIRAQVTHNICVIRRFYCLGILIN